VDTDGDTICDDVDVCPDVADPNQADGDGDELVRVGDRRAHVAGSRVRPHPFALGLVLLGLLSIRRRNR
jgi:hypothetical protein